MLGVGELKSALQAFGVPNEKIDSPKLSTAVAHFDGLFDGEPDGKLDFSEFFTLCIEIQNTGYELPDGPPSF